ncbi:MAG: NYN domain-containing protein [Kiritimatiellae bacterium]|nr:NYN domain-containing protein [Kiritimatiellia bacterium]
MAQALARVCKTGRQNRLFVDGYNVINDVPHLRKLTEQSLETARRVLLEQCTTWLRTRGDMDMVIVVFEGEENFAPSLRITSGGGKVRVVYTKKGETADDRIVSMIRVATDARRCVLVTADRGLSSRAEALGAKIVAPCSFVEIATRRDRLHGSAQHDDDGRGLSSVERAAINRDLLRIWQEK